MLLVPTPGVTSVGLDGAAGADCTGCDGAEGGGAGVEVDGVVDGEGEYEVGEEEFLLPELDTNQINPIRIPRPINHFLPEDPPDDCWGGC